MMYTIRTGNRFGQGQLLNGIAATFQATMSIGSEREEQHMPERHAGLKCLKSAQAAERGAAEMSNASTRAASQGFAIAMSSFGETGWAEKDGAQSTHQLRALFTSRVATPTRTYLIGVSLGGLMTVDLAESFPAQYDGALSLCGVVGGAPLEF